MTFISKFVQKKKTKIVKLTIHKMKELKYISSLLLSEVALLLSEVEVLQLSCTHLITSIAILMVGFSNGPSSGNISGCSVTSLSKSIVKQL